MVLRRWRQSRRAITAIETKKGRTLKSWRLLLLMNKNSLSLKAFHMKVFALKKLVSKFKAHITTRAIPGKTFIWLPFTGGLSAFAVILPKPCYAIAIASAKLRSRPANEPA
jgi:hypothetical protein